MSYRLLCRELFPARKKQRGPGKEGLAQDNPNPIRTTAEQHLFWLLREQHKTAAGPPDYTAMMAQFNVAWLKQTKLVLLQVKAPALLCILLCSKSVVTMLAH